MLEGLEANVLSYHDMCNENFTYRVDSEYFKKKFLKDDKLIEKYKWKNLDEIATIKGGKRLPLGESFSNRGVRYIRAEDVKNGFIEYENSPFISEELHQLLKLYQIKKDEIAITIVGNSIGDIAIAKFDLKKCNLTENCVKIISLELNPNYIFSFLLSRFGQNIIEREKVGTAQPKLAIERIRKIKIPLLSNMFQLEMQKVIILSHEKVVKSKFLYTEAEKILLLELGLDKWQPTIENNNIKTLQESFISSGRIDAEYYQPKYDVIENTIKNYHAGWSTLGKSFIEINTGDFCNEYQQKAKGLRFYIRNTNISKGQIIEDENYFVHINNLSKFTKEGDILTARVGAIGSFGTVNKYFDGSVYSDNVLSLRLNNTLLPDVYTCYLNSKINAELMEKIAGGSVQPLITQTSIKDLVIPIFPSKTQKIVSEKIQQSFALQAQSKQLLNLAKEVVETAIEQNEKVALNYLDKIVKEINGN